ncbi:class I SAM-dependent methyltransferase [Fontisubflavum oceani]|uniref:class I SAM-dependent methyltransferase n=1 Tax=Fontisubflavum oceani TaxID=2978973 RepID=UPI0025B57197|nr:class I SAM-dependent methyltransferase [Fontisubflavum oceani]WJY20967.1 class I SAM-dependent methyltransferase [Fontisubflavum oceani]
MAIGSDYKYSRVGLLRLYFAIFGTPDLHTHLRLSPFLQQVTSAVKRYKISRIFEPGCGRGINAFEITKQGLTTPYFGNDFNPDDIASAQKIASRLKLDHVTFAHADATTAIPKDDAYDAVLLLDIVEHIPDDAAFVRAVVENSADDCVYFVSAPTKTYPKVFGSAYHEKVGHVREGYTVEELEALFNAAGARLMSHSYATGLVARIGCFVYYRLNTRSNFLNAILGLVVLPFRYIDVFNSKDASCSLFCVFARGHSDL